MILKRTFHPVGHGAFYTEQFYLDGNAQPCFTAVFDCGRFEAAKEGWSYKKYKDAIENYVSVDSGLIAGQTINILFISHFHTDHILGVEFLLDNYDVKKIIMPVVTTGAILDSLSASYEEDNYNKEVLSLYEKFSGEYSRKVCVVDIQDFRTDDEDAIEIDLLNGGVSNLDKINKDTLLKYQGWYYKPYYKVDRAKEQALNANLQKSFPDVFSNNQINYKRLRESIEVNGIDSLKDKYTSVFGKDKHNSYSLTLFSGMPCEKACHKGCHVKANGNIVNFQLCSSNCLYMGDYEALGHKQKDLKEYYFKEWDDIGIVQVPHHGSEHNSDDEFYNGKRRICIISADSNDKYSHPDQIVLDAITNNHSLPIVVSENIKTKLCFTIQVP